MNELTIKRNTEIKLNSPELAKATDEILAIMGKASAEVDTLRAKAERKRDDTGRAVARILGKISTAEAYKVDGFKSVEDYAQKVLDMPKATAYALAAYGRAINDPKANPKLLEMSPFNFDAVKSLGLPAINAALEAGEISADMTQKELKEYRDAHKPENTTAKVLPRFNVIDLYTGKGYENALEGDMDEAMRGVYGDIEIIKLPKVEGENAPEIRKLYLTSNTPIVLHFFKINEKSTKAVKASARDLAAARKMGELGMTAAAINDILGTVFSDADIKNMIK